MPVPARDADNGTAGMAKDLPPITARAKPFRPKPAMQTTKKPARDLPPRPFAAPPCRARRTAAPTPDAALALQPWALGLADGIGNAGPRPNLQYCRIGSLRVTVPARRYGGAY